MMTAVLAIAFLATQASTAPPDPDWPARYRAAAKREQAKHIAELGRQRDQADDRIKRASEAVRSAGRSRDSGLRKRSSADLRKAKKDRMKIGRLIRAAKASTSLPAPTIPLYHKIQNGMIGELDASTSWRIGLDPPKTTTSCNLEVIQIFSADEVLVAIECEKLDTSRGTMNARITHERNRYVLLANVDTTGLVTGERMRDWSGVFEVTGTKSYETAAGSESTVFILTRRDKPMQAGRDAIRTP